VGSFANINGYVQRVTSNQSAWRVYDDVVADVRSFWVQTLQNAKRTFMLIADD
jgi:hypothetical protein